MTKSKPSYFLYRSLRTEGEVSGEIEVANQTHHISHRISHTQHETALGKHLQEIIDHVMDGSGYHSNNDKTLLFVLYHNNLPPILYT